MHVLLKGWTEQPRKNTTAAPTATMLMVLGGLIWGHAQIHKILAKEKQLEMLALKLLKPTTFSGLSVFDC